MRAVTYARPGAPADVLDVSTLPEPDAPGRGEIQIRVTAFAVHLGDLQAVAANPECTQLQRPGLEATGVITAVGPGVTALTPGQRVTVFPNAGSWAEVINADAAVAVVVPDGLPDEAAAQMLGNPLTVLMLRRAAEEHPSVGYDGVVVNNAAASTVGRMFTAVAQHHKIGSVSVVRSAERARQLATERPEVPVVSTDSPSWRDDLRAAAAGRPVAVVLDPIGGRLGAALFDELAPGGMLFTYGQMADEPMELHASDLLHSGRGVRGLGVGRWLAESPASRRASDLASTLAIVTARPESFTPAAVYGIDEIRAAAEHATVSGKRGAVVVSL